jgi:TonB family protein
MKIERKASILLFGLLLTGITAKAQTPITTMKLGHDQIGLVKTARGITTRLVFKEPVQAIICGDLYDPSSGVGSYVIQRIEDDIFLKPVAPEGISNLFVKTGKNSEHTYSFDLVVGTPTQAYRIVNIVGLNNDPLTVKKTPNNIKLITSKPPVINAIELPGSAHMLGIPAFDVHQGIQVTQPLTSPPLPSENLRRQVISEIIPAKALKKLQPVYPETARNNNISGSVVVEVTINEKGKVIKGEAVSGPLHLIQAAIDAAKRWKFEPATANGKPLQTTTRITFNFKR